jgi:hypothetical protein
MLEAGKYYIITDHTNDLAYEEGFTNIEDAIKKAQEIAPYIYTPCCLYIQPTEMLEQVELMCAEYVISVDGGEDKVGGYVIDEEIWT